jgi:hypothetical protein
MQRIIFANFFLVCFTVYANSEPDYLGDIENEYTDEGEDDEDATSGDTPAILSKPRVLQVMARTDVELPCETEAGGLFVLLF